MSEEAYEFETLPLSGIDPGTSLLMTGAPHSGARELALRMSTGSPEEGSIIVATNRGAPSVISDLDGIGIESDPERLAIVDCTGSGSTDATKARVTTVGDPSDLTGIGIRFSDAYQRFADMGVERVRTGVVSLSTLLTFKELRPVARFTHTLRGRIASVDGLGIFLIDPAQHDERAISTISQFLDGRIEVRDTGAGPEFRCRGLGDQPHDWVPFETSISE
ncbi:MAG: hypothetical protein ACI8UR_002343 [Natronomonas sp.]|jgi:hypothetical protein|uniref:DUF7504 family protein n=1 Tax=Natronomonas sp. TaxID=2184060 RepID=UPI003988E6F4